jgi:hypothetical protein
MPCHYFNADIGSGATGIRTPDLLHAMQAL